MVVFVLVREDQYEHGYVDTPITGVLGDEQTAADAEGLPRLARLRR